MSPFPVTAARRHLYHIDVCIYLLSHIPHALLTRDLPLMHTLMRVTARRDDGGAALQQMMHVLKMTRHKTVSEMIHVACG